MDKEKLCLCPLKPVSMKIQGKTVLITGGCSGIGEIMARRCLEKGARQVIIWDINDNAIEATAEELSAKGSVFGYKADICGLYTVMDHFTGRK